MSQKPADIENISAEINLLKAKIAFIKAADKVSPTGMIGRRPYTSLGVAFLLGFGLNLLAKTNSQTPLLASLAELGGIISRIAPLVSSRASSSGG